MSWIPTSFRDLFLATAPVFSQPSLNNFLVLVSGWICCCGRHTITRVIQAVWDQARKKHFPVFYRFLSRAQWHLDELGRVLFNPALRWIPGLEILVVVDDTLNRKSGPHIRGAAMHHDPLRSTYGQRSQAGAKVFFASGHRLVVLSVWVPLPWNPQRGVAVPILFRLYRARMRCPKTQYRKATELAAEMIRTPALWVPQGCKLMVTADCEYACKTLVRGLPEEVDFVSPAHPEAALFDLPAATLQRKGKKRRGPRCKKGPRLPTPTQWAQESRSRWTRARIRIYGKTIRVLIKNRICLWYRVAHTRSVLLVPVRDPRGRYEDRAYFCTDLSLAPEEVPSRFSKVDPRGHLPGFKTAPWIAGSPERLVAPRQDEAPVQEEAGTAGASHPWRAGRPPDAPLGLITYTFVHLWYFEHGKVRQDVGLARRIAPWYRTKAHPSFENILNAARREFWSARINRHPSGNAPCPIIRRCFAVLGIAG